MTAPRPVTAQRPADVVEEDAVIEVASYCARPACRQQFQQVRGRGRPREFCSEICRRASDKEYKQARAMVDHLQSLLTRSKYDVAAFGRGDDDLVPLDVEERHMANASAAVQRAQAVVEWARDADERLLSELRLLVDAVKPVVDDLTS